MEEGGTGEQEEARVNRTKEEDEKPGWEKEEASVFGLDMRQGRSTEAQENDEEIDEEGEDDEEEKKMEEEEEIRSRQT